MTIQIDLAEFVSDYWQMCRDSGVAPKTKEIADAYREATESDEPVTAALIADINYYLP